MTARVLFVCLGNICRSPSAEGVFRAIAEESGVEVEADSAGTSDWHIGEPPYAPMLRAAAGRGYELGDLRARQIGPEDFTRFDLIVAMDAQNREDIEQLRPAGNETPVVLFTDYAPETGMTHVPDPYYTREFDAALDLIEAAARGLLRDL